MGGRKTIFGFCLISIFCSAFAGGNVSDARTAYDLLQQYDFPIGILPVGVQSYLLRSDGTFEVYLPGDCEFKVQNKYLLRYRTIISGTVSSGNLRNLRGVSVKILFLWLPITDVVVNGDQVSFYVGPISASFPVSSFAESPMCRCGFDCVNDANLVSDS